MSIEIANIKKSFGRTQVLNDISLDIPSGQMVALLGPSGSGKTTLLRIIAGLEHQSSGHIRFHGTDVRPWLNLPRLISLLACALHRRSVLVASVSKPGMI